MGSGCSSVIECLASMHQCSMFNPQYGKQTMKDKNYKHVSVDGIMVHDRPCSSFFPKSAVRGTGAIEYRSLRSHTSKKSHLHQPC